MALTILTEPTTPCFTKNLIIYEVSTTNKFAVKARLFVEDVPQSGTYDFVSELKAWPDSDGLCKFNFTPIFEEDVLNYDIPSIYEDNTTSPSVCKRFKVDFFEFDPDSLTLVEEMFHQDSDSETLTYVDIQALTASTDYIIILESDQSYPPLIRSVSTQQTASLLYSLGDEYWYKITVPATGTYDEIKIPGYTKAYIYQGTEYTITTSSVSFVLLGGVDSVNYFLKLAAPVIFIDPVTETELDINWTYDSVFETSFELQVSTDGTNFTQESILPPNSENYNDTGLTTTDTMYYRMRAIRNATSSPWSEIVSFELNSWILSDGTWNDDGAWYDGENWAEI